MKPFIVMDIVKKANTLQDVIHLEVGQPDILPTPKVKESANQAIADNSFYYTPSNGLLELREKISNHYKKQYDIWVDPKNIIVTTGTSTAFLIAFYFAKKIATPTPGYPCYENYYFVLKL